MGAFTLKLTTSWLACSQGAVSCLAGVPGTEVQGSSRLSVWSWRVISGPAFLWRSSIAAALQHINNLPGTWDLGACSAQPLGCKECSLGAREGN